MNDATCFIARARESTLLHNSTAAWWENEIKRSQRHLVHTKPISVQWIIFQLQQQLVRSLKTIVCCLCSSNACKVERGARTNWLFSLAVCASFVCVRVLCVCEQKIGSWLLFLLHNEHTRQMLLLLFCLTQSSTVGRARFLHCLASSVPTQTTLCAFFVNCKSKLEAVWVNWW